MPCPSCGQSYHCHHVTGKCDCLPGYTGANCDQGCKYELSHYKSLWYIFMFKCNYLQHQYFIDCPPGYYGKMCSEVCDNCANNSTCNPNDGHCECLPGWTARDCSKRELTWFGNFFILFFALDVKGTSLVALGSVYAFCRLYGSAGHGLILSLDKFIADFKGTGLRTGLQIPEVTELGFLFIIEGTVERYIYKWFGATSALMQTLYQSVVAKKELSPKEKPL